MEHSYKFFSNKKCKYFPCHEGVGEDEFNCLFCFCPLVIMKDKCGGVFDYGENGIKNCMSCNLPHKPEYYDVVICKLKEWGKAKKA